MIGTRETLNIKAVEERYILLFTGKVTVNGYVKKLTSLLQLLPVVRLAAGRSVPAHKKVTFSKF